MKKGLIGFLAVLVLLNFTPIMLSAFAENTQHKQKVTSDKDHKTGQHDSKDAHGKDDKHGSSHGGHHAPHIEGKNLSLLWALPFLAILLSIALFPLLKPHFWHHHYGKVSLAIGVTFFIIFSFGFGINTSLFYLIETYLGDFIPFIVLLLALFTIAGGIRLKGDLVGTPKLNVILILIGTLLASWMGTTGAAMLLIRPVLKANAWRKYKVHVVVFFIFLVANIGGSLTPLGDPPLFLGFLKGVSFFWTSTHLLPLMLVATGVIITIFFIMDSYYYKKEPHKPEKSKTGTKIEIEGKINFLFLAGVIGAVIFSGLWHADKSIAQDVAVRAWGEPMLTKGTLVQILILLILTLLSLKFTSKATREGNNFNWEPILEVAKLFATIFITMVMPIAMLKAGVDGPLGAIIAKVSAGGQPANMAFFWATGSLSSFLDNAPTYVVFFNTAGSIFNASGVEAAKILMGQGATTLLAISAGAVFMGANTYIGNAPNFMVKSIAEESGVPMPSFFGYMLKYSIPILIPVFILIGLIFF